MVAIDKPESLLVHRSRLSHDHVFALQLLRDQIGRRVNPVHRLDRATSGVLLFALSSEIAGALASLFATRNVRKTYLAVVRGLVDETGVIDHPLREDGQTEPKEAVTSYTRLADVELPFTVDKYPTARYSLVQVRPHTGRTHQIRRHFKHISHHLVGDTTYGRGEHNRFFREQYGVYRLLLHAGELALDHPVTGQPLVIRSPVPGEMSDLFRTFGWTHR